MVSSCFNLMRVCLFVLFVKTTQQRHTVRNSWEVNAYNVTLDTVSSIGNFPHNDVQKKFQCVYQNGIRSILMTNNSLITCRSYCGCKIDVADTVGCTECCCAKTFIISHKYIGRGMENMGKKHCK